MRKTKHVMRPSLTAGLLCLAITSPLAVAGSLELTSPDIREGERMAKTFEFKGFGCSGENLSPALRWNKLPEGTQSIAITSYDPDAPTGSGWWHWIATDLPAEISELPRGADIASLGGREFKNDYGNNDFGGACPPPGHGMHRYQFTVWALPETKLEVPDNASPALVGYMLNSMALDSATLTATYAR